MILDYFALHVNMNVYIVTDIWYNVLSLYKEQHNHKANIRRLWTAWLVPVKYIFVLFRFLWSLSCDIGLRECVKLPRYLFYGLMQIYSATPWPGGVCVCVCTVKYAKRFPIHNCLSYVISIIEFRLMQHPHLFFIHSSAHCQVLYLCPFTVDITI